MQDQNLLRELLDGDTLFWVIGGLVGVIAIISSTLSSIIRTSARERSRREIAAYIAEGSMTPEQGERLMAAGKPKNTCA
jgi:hypothetical protein